MIVKPKLTIAEVNKIIALLRGHINEFSDSELFNYFNQLTIGLPMQTLNFERGAFIRGRPNIGSALFGNISELWYPPINDVRPNRFNDKTTQILYVADAKSTVIEEIKPMLGSIVTLITYSATDKITVLPIGISPGVTKQRLFNSEYLKNDNTRKIGFFNNDQNHLQIDQLVTEFLFDAVTKENTTGDRNQYRFTNIVGKHLFMAPVDGLMYPSISRKLYDINIAFKKEVKNKLIITQVDVIKMHTSLKGVFEIIACSNQFLANGEIVYNDHCGNFGEMTKFKK